MRAPAPLSALAAWLCAAACASSGHAALTATAQGGWYSVHALDRATAERVLSECQEIEPGVLAGPACGKPGPIEVYCMPVDAQYGEGRNLTLGDPELRKVEAIEIDIGRELAWERFVIAHELTHAWLAPEWNPLPQILEEGLADMAGARADPQAGVCRRLFHGLRLVTWGGSGYPYALEHDGRRGFGTLRFGRVEKGLPDPAAMLALDAITYHEVGGEQNENLLYAVGYALCDELGVPLLRELCARARENGLKQIPAAWVLDAAHLGDATQSNWVVRGLRLIGQPEERMLHDCLLDEGPFRFGKE